MWNPLRRRRETKERHLLEREAFRAAKRLAREDVTLLGEQVAALPLADDAPRDVRDHHRFALDGYEEAKARLEAADSLAEVEALDEVLQRARWERAAVLALEAGEPLPDRRGPCFFNPQHGPAVTTVDWTPPMGTARRVEVCRNDELRLATGADPDHREVRVGDRYVPWWQVSDQARTPLSLPLGATAGHGVLVQAAFTEAQLRAATQGLNIPTNL